MQQHAVSETEIAGAILGRMFPPLDLAADDLYARVNAGERIDGTHVPSSLGFETGVLDHVMVEAFKACVPAVKTVLTAGGLHLIAEWMRRRTAAEERKQQLELLRSERRVQDALERLIEVLLRRGTVSNRQEADEKLAQIITDIPERMSSHEDDDD
jgi:hypothetical protein